MLAKASVNSALHVTVTSLGGARLGATKLYASWRIHQI